MMYRHMCAFVCGGRGRVLAHAPACARAFVRLRACVRACLRACLRACVRERARVCVAPSLELTERQICGTRTRREIVQREDSERLVQDVAREITAWVKDLAPRSRATRTQLPV